jgi:DnaJ-class molecular chaperone
MRMLSMDEQDSNSDSVESVLNVVWDDLTYEHEVVYAVSEVRECPHCHGSGVEDQWDDNSGPCRVCWGECEL